MSDMIAINAAHWLEHTLWPIARAAAALPDDPDLDQLLTQPRDPPDLVGGSNSLARMYAEGLPLLGATLLACQLARSPRATAIRRLIEALVWRDAYELACARDLVTSMGMAGVQDDEYTDRHIATLEVWERWMDTHDRVQQEILTFASDSGAYALDPDPDPDPNA